MAQTAAYPVFFAPFSITFDLAVDRGAARVGEDGAVRIVVLQGGRILKFLCDERFDTGLVRQQLEW
jgi:hypothetical protein